MKYDSFEKLCTTQNKLIRKMVSVSIKINGRAVSIRNPVDTNRSLSLDVAAKHYGFKEIKELSGA